MRSFSFLRFYWLLVVLTGLLLGSSHLLLERFSEQHVFALAPNQWEYAFSASATPPQDWQTASQLQFSTAQTGKDLWLKVQLPPQQMTSPSLFIRRLNQNFEVFQGLQRIYHFGDLQAAPRRFNGYTWHLISLPKDIVSQTLYFRLHSEHRFIGIMSEVYFASQGQLFLQLLHQSLGSFMLGCLFLLLGLFALGLALFLPERHLSLLFGLFCFLLGVYTLCESDLTAIWLRIPEWITPVSLFALYFMPGCVYLFIRDLSGLRPLQRPLHLLAWAHFAFAGLSLFAVLLGFALMQTVLPFQVLALLGLLGLSAILLRFWLQIDPLTQVVGAGMLVFTGASLFDLLVAMCRLPLSLQLYPWGCLMFVLALLLVLLQRFLNLYQQQVQVAAELSASLASQAELKTAKEQAEEASRLKSQFLANLSHEIRTPLNAVMGFSELLEEDLTDPQQLSYLEAIHSGGKSLLGLLNDLLDLSKVEAGKLSLQLMPCDLRLLCHELSGLFSLPIEKKGLEWRLSVAPELPRCLYLDEMRVRQILLNLLGNAVKFTEQGQISLCVTGRLLAEGEWELAWQVQDTGLGIPLEAQELIFEPFHQQDGQSTRKYGGTGLGLAICRRLAELMGGRIELQSEPGQGSSFLLVLKAAVSLEQVGLFLPEPEYKSDSEFVPTPAPPPGLNSEQRRALKTQLEPLYRQIQKKRNLKLIRRFADEVQSWGQANQSPLVGDLGQELAKALQQFEIERVNRLVEQIAAFWLVESVSDFTQ